MTESADIQQLIDKSTVANKRSSLQVFELKPTRRAGTMFIDKNQRRIFKVLFLAVLAVALAILAALPARAQEETSFVFEKIHVQSQMVEMLGADGTSLGSGQLQAAITTSPDGRITGMVEVDLPAVKVHFNPTEIRLNKWYPLEVELDGRFAVTADGQTQSSTGTITIKEVKPSDRTSSSSEGAALVTGYDFLADPATAINGASLVALTELRFRGE